MVELNQLLDYTNNLLQIDNFKDYCPNGLQVEGKSQIERIVCGVTASQALIEQAIEKKADVLLVHHGFFWKGEQACITGAKKKRIAALLEHELNLLAYHLPLDAHPELGNNVQLANRLGIDIEGHLEGDAELVWTGSLREPTSASALADHLESVLEQMPLVVDARNKPIRRVAWCTGGAQSYIGHAIDAGVDAFITGEASEHNFHTAHEDQIDFFAAGHHATERYGVQALTEHLAAKFALEFEYVEIANPI